MSGGAKSDWGRGFVDFIVTPLVGQTRAFRRSLENEAEDHGIVLENGGAIELARRIFAGRCERHE